MTSISATPISDADIELLVRSFYTDIRADALLGPIFEAQITAWEPHLAKMMDFWSSVVNTTGRYKGQPMPAHARIPGLGGEHFAHWLEIFRATAHRLFTPDKADVFIIKAERIAESLELGVAFYQGRSALRATSASA